VLLAAGWFTSGSADDDVKRSGLVGFPCDGFEALAALVVISSQLGR
jgi:hypothetical protein